MRTPVDDTFVKQVSDYRLRFFCEDCVYFDAEHSECSEGYPNEEHRAVALVVSAQVCFCKSFELG
jgi:hypothetical protein